MAILVLSTKSQRNLVIMPIVSKPTCIDNDKKMNVFLAVTGPDAYKLLKNLWDPENPNTKTFTRLSRLLKGHFEPAPIVIAERHKFWTASQEESESLSEFVGNSWRD